MSGTIPPQVAGSLMASGFPFQTAVAAAIANTGQWQLRAQEFRYAESGVDRFLDIAADNGLMVVGIECKKTEKEILTFLNPGSRDEVTSVRCAYLRHIADSTNRMERYVTEWQFKPKSFEAMFCIVSTSASGANQRMLERDAQNVIQGTDAYALGDWERHKQGPAPERPYLPILVTNAQMFVADYAPSDVDLATGRFGTTPAKIRQVPWVRFTKSFGANRGRDLGWRTVFVVNALSLVDFLDKLDRVADPADANRIHFGK